MGGPAPTEHESRDENQYTTSYLVLPFTLYHSISYIASELWSNGSKMPLIQFFTMNHSTNIHEGSTRSLGLGVRHHET